jgi:hypothetical protein
VTEKRHGFKRGQAPSILLCRRGGQGKRENVDERLLPRMPATSVSKGRAWGKEGFSKRAEADYFLCLAQSVWIPVSIPPFAMPTIGLMTAVECNVYRRYFQYNRWLHCTTVPSMRRPRSPTEVEDGNMDDPLLIPKPEACDVSLRDQAVVKVKP